MERTRYIISDLHIGAGDELESFSSDKSFKYLIEAIGRQPGSELIINGDLFDFVSVSLEHESAKQFSRFGCTEEESLQKLERVMKAHPVVVSSLKKFLAKKGHRLVLVPGNHDIDLYWPRVRDRFREALGSPDDDRFYFEESGIYRDEDLYIEHGNQYFADTVFERFSQPILTDPRSGERRLERCWADCFHAYLVVSLMGKRNPFYNNVVPYYDLVLMCLQQESWWIKPLYIFKIFRFIYKVGFPPLKECRHVLLEKRRIGDEGDYFNKEKFLGSVPAVQEWDAEEMVDTMQWEHGYPVEAQSGAVEEAVIPLDILAARENTLVMAARDLLLSDEYINVVVFGHEHQYFTNEVRPEVSGRRGKYYMNTGTWVPMLFLNRTRRVLTWKDLRDQSLYQQLLTYGVAGSRGGDRANLKCLAGS